eukprot:3578820-Pleurochrysis_carterae.AAC.1
MPHRWCIHMLYTTNNYNAACLYNLSLICQPRQQSVPSKRLGTTPTTLVAIFVDCGLEIQDHDRALPPHDRVGLEAMQIARAANLLLDMLNVCKGVRSSGSGSK